MSGADFLTGAPAFTALLPDFPAAEPARAEAVALVARYCGEDVAVAALGPQGEGPAGRYVVTLKASGRRLFLKVFEDYLVALQRHADQVAAYLSGFEVPVIVALPGEPRPIAPGHHGMLFRYVDARFSALSADELGQIGGILALVHRALASYPGRHDVAEAGALMERQLQAAAQRIVAGWAAPSAPPALLRQAADTFLADRPAICCQPQMIHGDCNYTNILFDKRDGAAWIIDFEESRAAWLNPAFDVAVALQRFVMAAPEEDGDALARALLSGYRGKGGRLPGDTDFHRLLQEATYRSVLILAEKTLNGMPMPAAEWTKFAQLARMTAARKGFLDAVSGLARAGS